MMTIDNVIDLVMQPVRSSQIRNWLLLEPAKMKNDVTIQLYFSRELIAESFNFMLHD